MSERRSVLVIDDGELGRIRKVLDESHAAVQHLRGRVQPEDLEGRFDVVVATVKQTLALEDHIEIASLPGKPVWIAIHAQDFLPLRVRLRKMGVHYLVQSSVGSTALRLLLKYALHRNGEKRGHARLPVGSPIACRDEGGTAFDAELLELARDACRVLTPHEFTLDAGLTVILPEKLAGGDELTLWGRVGRIDEDPETGRHLVTVSFDELGPIASAAVDAILEGKVIGTVVTRLGEELTEEVAPTTIRRGGADATPAAPRPAARRWRHQRQGRRVEYTRDVTLLAGGEHVVLGRDLSEGGLRTEPLPELHVGTELELAVYGASGAEPVLARAVVARQDGALGTVFHFLDMAPGDRPRLAAIVASNPDIHALEDGSSQWVVVPSNPRKLRPGGGRAR